jgi:predicted dehydrogenase
MIRIGLIGAGRIARVHARTIGKIKEASLASVYDLETDRARQLASDFGGRAFANPGDFWRSPFEAAVISVPTFLHREMTLAAIQSGRHVLCEKPIASSLEEAGEMIDRARGAGIRFLVGHVLRFHPAYEMIQDRLREGRLGEVRHLRASRVSGGAGGSWKRWLLERPEGLGVFDLNIHDLDFIYSVLGKPCRVKGAGICAPQQPFHHVDALLEFSSGAKANVEGSFLVPPSHPFQYELRIIGEKGCLSYNFRGANYEDAGARQEVLFYMGEKAESLEIQAKDPFEREMRYFLRCAKSGENVEIGTGEDARGALEIALAARQSSLTGQVIDLH